MTEQFAVSQSASIKAPSCASAIPLLFRSSEESNWEGLVLRAFHEPGELEGWIDPAVPDTSLVLVTQGAMYMEQHLLKEADVPLAHIALECGFANQSHLSLVLFQSGTILPSFSATLEKG